MSWVVTPNYSLDASLTQLQQVIDAVFVAATALPFSTEVLADPVGTPLEFAAGGETRTLAVPIPRLAGLDELEVDRLDFSLASATFEDDISVSAHSVSASGLAVRYADAQPGATLRLNRVEIHGLKVAATDGQSYVLAGASEGGGATRVVYQWDSEAGAAVPVFGAAVGTAQQIHILVRPEIDGQPGPPAAAAPYFEMPGSGGTMYGPALGGATVTLSEQAEGVRAVVRFFPPIEAAGARLVVGTTGSLLEHEGLPNEVASVGWSADSAQAWFDLRPAGISVTAGTGGSDTPVVAEFATDPGATPVQVDFASVARSLLKSAYPVSQGADLGLELRFTSDTPGKLVVNLGNAAARYLRYPVADGALAPRLRGMPETVQVPVPQGLRPAAFSFTADGRYGPARLTDGSDSTPIDSRRGFRVGAGVRLARRALLTTVEQALPLARLALYGRASEPSELLVALHAGDEQRIGPMLGDPLSLEVEPSAGPAWQRIEYPTTAMLPPHPAGVWVVAQVTRGAFWWHGGLDQPGSAQRSADDGGSWSQVNGRPLVQVAVTEVDQETGNPVPAYPLSLYWTQGILNPDLVGVAGREMALPAEFRRFWIAEGAGQTTLLDGIATLDGLLALSFSCRRDVDLNLSAMVLNYDPWQAGGT